MVIIKVASGAIFKTPGISQKWGSSYRRRSPITPQWCQNLSYKASVVDDRPVLEVMQPFNYQKTCSALMTKSAVTSALRIFRLPLLMNKAHHLLQLLHHKVSTLLVQHISKLTKIFREIVGM